MKYVYMLTDTASDNEPPDLYSSKEKALQELKKRFNETLETSIFLTEEEKKELRKKFKKEKTWFSVTDGEPKSFLHKAIFSRSCYVTQEYIK